MVWAFSPTVWGSDGAGTRIGAGNSAPSDFLWKTGLSGPVPRDGAMVRVQPRSKLPRELEYCLEQRDEVASY